MRLDAVIFGGGVAGLWLLDQAVRSGHQVLLFEAHQLGMGQTLASQGIIHGGVKYSLKGTATRSAQSIREMPELWQKSFNGERAPLLKQTAIRSPHCYLWQTNTLTSRLGMLGARLGLSVTPELVPPAMRPDPLHLASGPVAKLGERVICARSLIQDLANQHRGRILKFDLEAGLTFETSSPGEVCAIRMTSPDRSREWRLFPRHVFFTAGAGNARLRAMVGLDPGAMQRRPLHMVLARGPLPALYGHCVDGMSTRVTITSAPVTPGHDAGPWIWQIGGQMAEDGVQMEAGPLVINALRELSHQFPQLPWSEVMWSTYRVDRAEGATSDGRRPDSIQVLCAGNVTTGWPTKLVLAPVLAESLSGRMGSPMEGSSTLDEIPAGWPRPEVGVLPWDEPQRVWWSWQDLTSGKLGRAAA